MAKPSLFRPRVSWGIASALTVSMVFVIVLLMALVTFVDIRRERAIARDGLEQYGILMANGLNEVLANDLYFSQIDALDDIAEVLASQPQIAKVKIFRPDGRLLVEQPRAENGSDYVTGQLSNPAALNAVRNGREWRQFEGTTLDLAIPVSVGEDLLGGVQFSFTAEAINEEIRSIIREHLWQGLALIVLGTALAYLIARYTSRSIGDLAAVAGEIGRGNLDVPAPSRGTKETVALGQALEGMRIQLKELYPNLEQRVQERTTELSRAAQKLQIEVAEREKAEQEQRRLTEESQLVAGIGRVIGSSLNVVEVYEGFAALVGQLVPCDMISINRIDLQRGTYTMAYVSGAEIPGRGAGTVMPLEGTFTGAVVQSSQGVVLDLEDNDECAEKYPGLAPYLEAGVRSFLGVPLVSRGEVIATLNLVPSSPIAYTEHHLQLARNIGAQIAGAIANAEIYSQREKAEQAARQLAAENHLLADVGRIITLSPNIYDVYHRFADRIREHMAFDYMSIALVGVEDGVSISAYVDGVDIPGRRSGDRVPLSGTLTSTVMSSRSAKLVETDIREELEKTFPGLLIPFDSGMRTFISVPLIAGDEVIAVLNVRSARQNAYSQRELGLMEQVGRQIAPAIENARLFEQIKSNAEEMAAVDEVGRLITTSLDLDEVYERFAEEVKKLVDFDRISINVIEEDPDAFTFKYSAGKVLPGRHIPHVVPLDGTQTQRVLETARTLVVPDSSKAAHFSGAERFLQEGLKSSIMVPLIHQGRVLGTMSLRSQRLEAYRDRDQVILERLASQIAPAVENAQLYGQTKRAEEEAHRLAEENRLVAEIGRIVSSSLDINETYELFAAQVRNLIPFSQLQITMIDQHREWDKVAFSTGLSDSENELGESTRLEGSITGHVASSRVGMIVQEMACDEVELKYPCLESSVRAGNRSWLAVPLITRDEAIGALFITSTTPMAFTQYDLDMAQRIGNQIAPAMANSQLFEELKEGQENLRNLSRRLVEVQEGERRHVARELHDEIGQVLTGLKFSLELIPRMPEEVVKANLEESKSLVNELMGKVRELSLDLRPAMLDDLGLLPTLLWYFERFTARTQVDVGFEHTGLDRRFLPEVETSAYRIVQEALTNVARHAGADAVSVRLWSNDEVLGLSIEDHGAGFDAGDESILSKSNGLAGMRERATLLGGQLTLESVPGLGTNLFAELPFISRNEINVERNGNDNHSLGG